MSLLEATPSPPSPRPQQNDETTLLLSEMGSVGWSHDSLQSKFSSLEETIFTLQHERDAALGLVSSLETSFRDRIKEIEEKEDEFSTRVEAELARSEQLQKEADFLKERVGGLELEVEEIKGRNGFLLKALNLLVPVKDCLVKIIQGIDGGEEKVGSEEFLVGVEDEELRAIGEELVLIKRLASEVECKVEDLKGEKEKEKKELESSVVSLTEENRDINTLLRVALVEKDAMEKKLKGGSNEQKKVALLQFAERGLRGVGFGFMMGGGAVEEGSGAAASTAGSAAPSSTTASVKSDGSEYEEEVPSLASTVEKVMKNLRLEISQLRKSLEESRSDNERLQSLTAKQAQDIAGNTMYIKELEERERILAQNIEELLTEIKETEADVARWREACELEVEAGKLEIGERDKVVSILRQELEKTKAALDIANGKLTLKEELANAAMAAQAAAERSLQLADSRGAELRERIEGLTRQLEEAESRERSRHKVRHICWRWWAPKVNVANDINTRFRTSRMLPEMQALLQPSV